MIAIRFGGYKIRLTDLLALFFFALNELLNSH